MWYFGLVCQHCNITEIIKNSRKSHKKAVYYCGRCYNNTGLHKKLQKRNFIVVLVLNLVKEKSKCLFTH